MQIQEAAVTETELWAATVEFPEEDYECLVEDCITWLADHRAYSTLNDTLCPISEEFICEKFANEKSNSTKIATMWQSNGYITVTNILRVVDSQKWQNCAIVYDIGTWPTMHVLTSSLSDRQIDFSIFDLKTVNVTSDIREMLEDMLSVRRVRNFILMAHDPLFYEEIFQQAEDYDISLGRTSGLRMFTQWIVTTSTGEEEQVTSAAAYFDNVVAVMENREVILSNSSGSVSNGLECVVTEISTLMYATVSSREFRSCTVLLPGGDLVVNDSFPNTRYGFNTRTLTIGTKPWDPFVIKTTDSEGTLQYTGLCMDLLNLLADVLNFTYVIHEPPFHEGWGDQNASGYWEGLVGQLYREEVDLVVAPLSFSIERALAMDATYPYATNNLAAVYKKRDPNLDKWRTYLRPFQGEVLLCLGMALIFSTALVHVMAWVGPESISEEEEDKQYQKASSGHREKSEKSQKKKKQLPFPGPSPDDGFWYLYGALLSQGGVQLPTSGSGRMLVASWWLFSIVMGATYSGNLIAFLTVQLESKPFSTLGEMLEQDDYVWGVLDKTSTHTMLMKSRNYVLREIGRKLYDFAESDPDVLSMDGDVQWNKIIGGGYVHITDSVTAEAWSRANCDLDYVVDYDSVSIPYTVNLPRGSDYSRLFDDCVMRIVEAGMMKKWKREWFADTLLCAKSLVSSSPKITVLDVQSALYLCAIGFGLALIVLAIEGVCHRFPTLRSWTSRLAIACVTGCKDSPAKTQHSSSSGPAEKQSSGLDGKRGYESDFYGVFVVDNKGDEEKKASTTFSDIGFFDFRREFLYNTVYATPEDFGRVAEDPLQYAAWDAELPVSRPFRISDDIKITT